MGENLMLQVKQEIAGSLDFLQAVYKVFGFSFKLYLSTRPEKYMGDLALWDMAEKVHTYYHFTRKNFMERSCNFCISIFEF